MIRSALLIGVVTFAAAPLFATSALAEGRQRATKKVEKQREYPDDGMNYRERMAVNYMKQRLRRVYPTRDFKTTVTPALVQYPGNKQRPITGYRPVEVDASVKMKKSGGGWWKRWRHNASRKSKSRYHVDVRRGALPAVLEQQSMTATAKLARVLPVGEKIHDVLHSEGMRRGAGIGGLGVLLSEVSLPVALTAVGYGATEMYRGVSRRNEARGVAVEKTADWARASIADGVTPTAAEAFSTYKQYLEIRKAGTHPGTLTNFLNRLATQGL